MAKKIKSFTVDEEIYNSLINKFKDRNIETSISFLLNKHLKELLDYIEAIEEELKKSKEHTVPVSFIINSLGDLPNFDVFKQQGKSEKRKLLKENIEKWQKKYDEEKEEKTSLTLNPAEYREYKAIEKEYGINDAIKFLFKVLSKQVKMRRELTDEEYMAEENAIGSGFSKYRKEKIVPQFDKIDKHLDKFFKGFEIRVKEEPAKK
ncbi:MAG: hypothetical protein PHU49_13130 [Syntrophorhabdaceae bacterium]|nr:hypothetical protein [Syntrophorhabdaceae bacterium]MDD5244951.1 hypothetical protein [Syntrophorhabdaceae bacterium]